ncbi:glutathione S-transferase family protein [uncultured Rhodospira sp.]|uniref:glutathione S-transferase family protein n=1 Tax=uncultured Rhodospira sp. TaxID=1936189 RepID=UPI002616D084|nr:glutathione S-transferase family protein [uncultured Rhodospira sp.]
MTTLYFAPDNASLVIRLVLEELEVSYDTVLVDRSTREQESAAYKRLNPQGLIPVCVIDGEPVFETAAIALLLADRHGGLAPAPANPARGRFLSWLFFASNTLHTGLRLVFYPHLVGNDPEAIRLAHARARHAFGLLDAAYRAGDGPWLCDGTLSVVDLYAAVCLRWAQLYPADAPLMADLAQVPGLTRMAEALQERPAAFRAGAAEGITAPMMIGPTPPDGSRGAAV